MKILAVSDLHLDKSTLGRPRYDDIRSLLRQAVDKAIEERVDAFACLGDICDPDDGPALAKSLVAVQEAARTLLEAGVFSIWIAGNHDVVEDGSGITTLSPMKQMNGQMVAVHEQPGWSHVRGLDILALPYTASSHPYDARKFVTDALPAHDPIRPLIVLSHLMIDGIQPGEETKEMPRGRDIMLPRDLFPVRPNVAVLSGHYHKQQVFKNVHVVGSIVRLTMGERDNRPGALLVSS